MSSVRRIVFADPACVQEVGHNLNGLVAFSHLVRDGSKIERLACRYLDEAAARRSDVRPFFEWYYPGIFTARSLPTIASDIAVMRPYVDSFEQTATRETPSASFESLALPPLMPSCFPARTSTALLACSMHSASLKAVNGRAFVFAFMRRQWNMRRRTSTIVPNSCGSACAKASISACLCRFALVSRLCCLPRSKAGAPDSHRLLCGRAWFDAIAGAAQFRRRLSRDGAT